MEVSRTVCFSLNFEKFTLLLYLKESYSYFKPLSVLKDKLHLYHLYFAVISDVYVLRFPWLSQYFECIPEAFFSCE